MMSFETKKLPTKYEGHYATAYIAIPDTGYSAICPRCNKRTNEEKSFINRVREIDIIVCEACEAKKLDHKTWKYRALKEGY